MQGDPARANRPPLSAADLSPDALGAALGGRPVRYYPSLLSTEADALAWARADGPHGAVVVGGHQVSPRGRGGIPWQLDFAGDLCFSIVLRPALDPERADWLYIAAVVALARELPKELRIAWPDELLSGETRAAAVGVQTGLGPQRLEWAVVTLALIAARRPRAQLLAVIARGLEAALAEPSETVLDEYREGCATIGRRVRVRLLGVRHEAGTVTGRAHAVRANGALVVERDDDGRRLAVLPTHLRTIELL